MNHAAAAGDSVYLGLQSGLMVLNVRDPARPQVVSQWSADWVGAVEVMDPYVYVHTHGQDGPRLSILDLSQPERPVVVGSCALLYPAARLRVAEGHAVLASSSLQLLDVHVPTAPRLVGRVAGGDAAAADLAWPHVYVGYPTRLAVYAISEPAGQTNVAVRMISAYPLAASAIRLAGQRAYVAGGVPRALHILDVSSPAHPRKLGSWGGTYDPMTLEIVGDLVCLGGRSAVSGRGLLVLVDAADPENPVALGQCEIPGYEVRDLKVAGLRACVTDGQGRLHLVDLSDPSRPKVEGGFHPGGEARALRVAGEVAFLADGVAGLRLLDVRNPSQPLLLGEWVTEGEAQDVCGVGTQVYLATGGSRVYELIVVDASSPTQPIMQGRWRTGGDCGSSVAGVAVAGQHAYVATSGSCGDDLNGLRVLDVSNPANPVAIGGYPAGGRSLSLSGQYLSLAEGWFEGSNGDLFDVSHSDRTWRLGSLRNRGRSTEWVHLDRQRAYVAAGDEGLTLLDLSDPSAPVEVASQPTEFPAHYLTAAGNLAFVGTDGDSDHDSLLEVFDTSRADRPVRVATARIKVRGLQVVGNTLYVAAGSEGLRILEMTPRLVLSLPVLEGDGLRLTWVGAPGLRLQHAASLSDPAWQDVPDSEGVSSLWLSPVEAAAFYRLVQP
ncbi:MAG: hypothetical protein HS113_24125 [Verrucomicrobiales bacterium]|nr:hypothetical protein [Verrucomicrobiales bacterium]